jgi:hypothetical protein
VFAVRLIPGSPADAGEYPDEVVMVGSTDAHDELSTCDALYRYQNLISASGELMVLVLQPPARLGELRCDGVGMTSRPAWRCSAPIRAIGSHDVRPGERFADPESGLMVICPRGGSGTLTFECRPLRSMPPHRT